MAVKRAGSSLSTSTAGSWARLLFSAWEKSETGETAVPTPPMAVEPNYTAAVMIEPNLFIF